MPRVVASAAEAVTLAAELAASLAVEAAERDRDRRLPVAELDALSDSGLLGITVPREFGGAGVPVAALAEVVRLLAVADASIAQIPQSHFVFLEALRLQGDPEQQRRLFARALAGERFANAQSERSGRTAADDDTVLTPAGDDWLLSGEKFYSTGALFAQVLVVRANLAGLPQKSLAFVPRDAPGVTVVDDWDGIGQRTTASGTVRLDDVLVPRRDVVPFTAVFAGPTTFGARAQVLHAAIDAGIARGALAAGIAAVGASRPYFESGVDQASQDTLVVQEVGELEIAVRSAEALLRSAAAAIDAAEAWTLTDGSTAEASVATAAAKVAAARVAVDASSALFELGGTRSAAGTLNLDRFWRDARTHSLHDPVRWKVQHVGRWALAGVPPPRHGLL